MSKHSQIQMILEYTNTLFHPIWEKFTRIKYPCTARYGATDYEVIKKESQNSILFSKKDMDS